MAEYGAEVSVEKRLKDEAAIDGPQPNPVVLFIGQAFGQAAQQPQLQPQPPPAPHLQHPHNPVVAPMRDGQ